MGKLAFYSKWTLRISIIAAAIYDLFILRWVGLAGGAAIFVATYLVDFINMNKKRFSDNLISLVYIFCMFALVLGVMVNLYDIIWWWDLLMHVVSGVVLGIIANAMLDKIQNRKKVEVLTRFLFVIGVATLGGIFWEIYEFSVDAIAGLDTQKVLMSGVSDTMEDIIANLIGSIAAGIYFAKFGGNKK
jgi:ABC-type multidrug transport system fused ATPase/permease subunit